MPGPEGRRGDGLRAQDLVRRRERRIQDGLRYTSAIIRMDRVPYIDQSGLYVLEIRTANGVQYERIILQH